MKSGKGLFAISLVFWVLMMSLLVWNHHKGVRGGGGRFLLGLVRSAPASESWYAIYREGHKVGFCQISLAADALSDAVAYRIDFYATLIFPEEISIQGDMKLRDPGGVTGFSLQLRSDTRLLFVNGLREDDAFEIEYDLGDIGVSADSPLEKIFSSSPGRVRIPLDRIGEVRPQLTAHKEKVVKIRGVFTPVRRYELSSGSSEINLWVDAWGNMVKVELPGGISVVREPRSLATAL